MVLQPSIRQNIEGIVGKHNVSENFYKISDYCMNHVAKNIFAMSKYEPFLVVRPQNLDQLINLVKYANNNSIPIFIRGGGTGYSGGEVPTSSGIVLEMTGLNKVISVDAEGRYVVCEAGITVLELNNILQKKYGLWWPHDPGSREWATVGGSISTLGCGAYTTKYGYASDNVVSMKVVTPEGNLATIGSKVRHDATSYNLLDLMTSAEGTLGVIVEATLKVFPTPEKRIVSISLFEKFQDAVKACYDIADSGLYPESLMLEDVLRFTLEGLAPFIDLESPIIKKLKLDSIEAAGIVSYAGKNEVTETSIRQTNKIIQMHNGKIIEDREIINAYWRSKTELPSWSKELGNIKIHSFVPAIPLYKAPQFYHKYVQVASELDLSKVGARFYVVLPYLECTISPTVAFDDKDPENVRNYEEFTRRLSQEVIQLEGAPASTTGVGMRLIDVVEHLLDHGQMELARKIKSSLDPGLLFNRGKKLRV
ncbi:MAG: FAD-binding oxidoreductase [Candidatus Caldarchaeum sp.]